MSTDLKRAAMGLGLGAAASVLLSLADGIPWRLVPMDTWGVVALLVLGGVAAIGGLAGQRWLVWIATLGFAAAAAVQLVQLTAGGTNTLGGNGSTFALLLGFAVGLFAVAVCRATPDEADLA